MRVRLRLYRPPACWFAMVEALSLEPCTMNGGKYAETLPDGTN